VNVKQNSYSRRQAAAISGLTTRQLGYWRKTGLVVPQHRTDGGHARYSFADLIALRTAKRLLDAGVSLQRIRHCLQSLTRFLPTAGQPLAELSLVVTGDVVLVFHGQRAFDALTGQEWVFAVAELAREVEQLREQLPQQGELFPIDPQPTEASA
jgi:DNA-binding transcriptional MerR regulator